MFGSMPVRRQDFEGESLVPAARNILLELGMWERFLGSGHVPCYGNVAAWGSSELVAMDFIRSPYGHGWHLDRTRFDPCCKIWPSKRAPPSASPQDRPGSGAVRPLGE